MHFLDELSSYITLYSMQSNTVDVNGIKSKHILCSVFFFFLSIMHRPIFKYKRGEQN